MISSNCESLPTALTTFPAESRVPFTSERILQVPLGPVLVAAANIHCAGDRVVHPLCWTVDDLVLGTAPSRMSPRLPGVS